jgi:hypothetical protein
VIRYALRTDGFVSVNAPFSGGEMVTRPVTFAGRELILNLSTSAVGSVRVEIQDVSGEPVPVDKHPGAAVIGGTVNGSGALTFRATRVGHDTTLQQIVRFVQEAQGSKPKVQEIADRIAAIMRLPQHTLKTSRRTLTIRSTNQLLRTAGLDVMGGKTGFIQQAG